MRAIFINAVDRKVEEVQVGNDLQAIYAQIGCETIELIGLGRNYVLIVDEEGLLRNWKAGFRLANGEKIAGNGLVACEDRNGDFTDCPLPVGKIAGITEFLNLEKNPLPPPQFGIAVISEMTPDGIAKAREEAAKDMARHR